MDSKQKYFLIVFLVIIILIILTLIISHFNLDIRLQQLFYHDNSWYLAKTQPWLWFYKYGTYPGIILGIISIVYLLFSLFIKKFIPYRRYALLVILTLIIGPGLLVNATFKDRWGRPRPRDLQQFGGKCEFQEVWQPGIPGKGKSFPSGHASMGFHFIVVYYLLEKRNRVIRYSALGGSVIYGSLIGVARMAQGGHFASDVIWAAGFTYLTAFILFYFVLKIPQKGTEKHHREEKPVSLNRTKIILRAIGTILCLALLIWIYCL